MKTQEAGGLEPLPQDLSAADLIRACGHTLTSVTYWDEFQRRFQKRIFLYVARTLRHMRDSEADNADYVTDLTQDVYARLVERHGRLLASFKGASDVSAYAFLARVSANVVGDHVRRNTAQKRWGNVIPLDQALLSERRKEVFAYDLVERKMNSLLYWIDVDRLIQMEPNQRFAARNLLIFKLHYQDGKTVEEIALVRSFELTPAGVNAALERMRRRLRSILPGSFSDSD